ncbi:MAG: type II toxin-antitoxin system VapC family toxin [Terracidiphilus sp.]|jgi:predicted nucleic acid-binding protein
MPGKPYLVDSNVLIRWVQPEGPQFEVVRKAILRIENTDDTPCYTSQNLGEFWNVLTRPADRNGYGLSPEGARIRAEQIEAKFLLLPDNPEIHIQWRRLLVAHSISGVQVHDARLAAAMHVHGVKRILTFNTRDFARFIDIEASHPADFSQ